MTIKSVFIILSLFILAVPLIIQTSHAESVVQVKNSSQSITLDMQNMTCAMCKFTIKKALQGVEGVQKADVDFDSKMATVTFDPQKTNSEALINATTRAGYPATVHSSNN
ncbi:MAG: cation transporter [Methylobacter sp.]|nr:cation transporter [Methylobacter sp.]